MYTEIYAVHTREEPYVAICQIIDKGLAIVIHGLHTDGPVENVSPFVCLVPMDLPVRVWGQSHVYARHGRSAR